MSKRNDDDLSYTDKKRIQNVEAQGVFLKKLRSYPDFQEDAKEITDKYPDYFERRWEEIVSLRLVDQHLNEYYESIVDLCQKYGALPMSWGPINIHHQIQIVVADPDKPTWPAPPMIFYRSINVERKRARPRYTLEQAVDCLFLRVIEGKSTREICQETYPYESESNIDKQISRAAQELGIKLR